MIKKIVSLVMITLILIALTGCSTNEKVIDKSITLKLHRIGYTAQDSTLEDYNGKYTGEVDKNGNPNGKGKLIVSNNKRKDWKFNFTLEGSFVNCDLKSGKIIFSDNGKSIESSFDHGRTSGSGKILFKDGKVQYDGTFSNNIPISLKDIKPDYILTPSEFWTEYIKNNNNNRYNMMTDEFRNKYYNYSVLEIKGRLVKILHNSTYNYDSYVMEDEKSQILAFVVVDAPKNETNIDVTKGDIITVRAFGYKIIPPENSWPILAIDNTGYIISKAKAKQASIASIVKVQK